MPKAKTGGLQDKPVKWPLASSTGSKFNKTTKVPVVKTAVVGLNS
mgnify:CR=1 FL=1